MHRHRAACSATPVSGSLARTRGRAQAGGGWLAEALAAATTAACKCCGNAAMPHRLCAASCCPPTPPTHLYPCSCQCTRACTAAPPRPGPATDRPRRSGGAPGRRGGRAGRAASPGRGLHVAWTRAASLGALRVPRGKGRAGAAQRSVPRNRHARSAWLQLVASAQLYTRCQRHAPCPPAPRTQLAGHGRRQIEQALHGLEEARVGRGVCRVVAQPQQLDAAELHLRTQAARGGARKQHLSRGACQRGGRGKPPQRRSSSSASAAARPPPDTAAADAAQKHRGTTAAQTPQSQRHIARTSSAATMCVARKYCDIHTATRSPTFRLGLRRGKEAAEVTPVQTGAMTQRDPVQGVGPPVQTRSTTLPACTLATNSAPLAARSARQTRRCLAAELLSLNQSNNRPIYGPLPRAPTALHGRLPIAHPLRPT